LQIKANRRKKVEELSKGNQQKVQFLAAILHDPDVLIMDEPFSGLDPINANILKEAFLEMHRRGKTIIFSTHQMAEVEELCEDILLINKGQVVLKGGIHEVKRQYGRNVVRLKLENDAQAAWLDALPGVQVTHRRQDYIEMHIQAHLNPNLIVEAALGTVAWWEYLLTIGLMLLTILVLMVFAARLYRYGVLMYGQRPGLGQLVKMVRMK
jgi:ABC-2 type transport system ATP-binding protein